MSQHAFQAEVQQLLHLMIHSLYSEREIFLRELISNASDACDKLRFEALTEPDLLRDGEELVVRLRHDKEARTLVVEDSGRGMSEEEIVAQLGTIAKSGTKEFVAALRERDGSEDGAGLIGQFGVGFYSAFMVAERVVVESRSAHVGSDAGVRWESSGDGTFTTQTIARPQRGTTITLHLKDDAEEFCEPWRLRSLVKRHSDYVSYPIMMPGTPKEGEDSAPDEQVNAGKPLWTRDRDEITDEQYTEFYHGACKQWDEPATRLHFSVEGTLALKALLFVPSTRPMDLFDQQHRGLSLYVRRVFIMDDCRELLPEYLRFVRGVIDSDDLPLNVSREMLQQESVVRRLRSILTKRILDHLDRLARSEDESEQQAFTTIDRQFGPILREGLVSEPEQRDRLLKLVRYRSTWTIDQEGDNDETPVTTSLEAYLERRPEGQKAIFYLTAPSLAAARTAPQLEGYRKKGYEVLLLCDPVDEWVVNHVREVKEVPLTSIAQGTDDLADEAQQEALKAKAEQMQDFLGFCAEAVPGLKEVRLSGRLTDSPCCVVSDDDGMSRGMMEMMRRMGQQVSEPQRILELNPDHPLITALHQRHQEQQDDPALATHLATLRDQALLAEGGQIDDPAAFARRVQDLLCASVGLVRKSD